MFKYSRNWLSKLAKEKIDYKDLDKNWLDLQGFEVATETKVGDDVIVELEVKANRPDMLSHLGVLREYYVFKDKKELPNIKSKLNINDIKDELSIKAEINSTDVKNLALIEIKGVDNTKESPKEMKELLEGLGVKSINPIVDISNYIMLETGQPIHIYDLDKVNGILNYKNAVGTEKIKTLNGEEISIPEDSIIISDKNGVCCLAGIVGSSDVEIDENTKNILIEAAEFNLVRIRLSSQRTHISTLASYRFERGVDGDNSLNSALLTSEQVLSLCGGTITGKYVVLNKKPKNIKHISVEKTNKLLGTKLTSNDIQKLLENYYYTVDVSNSKEARVVCPDYRLDLEQEVDVIADIAQMYGYHNIEPTTANLSVKYEPNVVKQNGDKLRELMLSQGLNECISYTFIHENSNKMLNLKENDELFSEIKIINPLSNKFALMRKNMIYSMVSTLTYNLSKNNECEPIFEVGTVFFKDKNTDTGYNQKTMLSALLYGNKIEKGFGINQNVPYDFYDIKAILELIANEFSQDISLKEADIKVFETNRGAEIYVDGRKCGIIGTLNSKLLLNFENGKLIKGEVQYLELCVDNLIYGTTQVDEISKYPSVIRQYNMLVPTTNKYEDYSKDILALSDTIKSIEVQDIYKGKGVKEGCISVLLALEYSSMDKTLSAEEITEIEDKMYKVLQDKYAISLKQ